MIVPCRELLPVITGALIRGQRILIEATGSSMQPFIYNGDTIELVPKSVQMKIGDIVLAELPHNFYIAHRIVKLGNNSVYLRGDNQIGIQGPISNDHVIALVSASVHNGKTRRHDKGLWRILGVIWIKIYRITPALKTIYHMPRRFARFSFKLVFGVNFREYIKRFNRKKK